MSNEALFSAPVQDRLTTLPAQPISTPVFTESDSVLAADVSPDQTRVALGGPGKAVRIYSTRDGKLLSEIRSRSLNSRIHCQR